MIQSLFKRGSRWIRQEGWRGTARKIKYILRYWHFRRLVARLKKKHSEGTKAESVAMTQSIPTFSVLMPAYRTQLSWLREALSSLRAQTDGNWELCIGLSEVEPEVEREVEEAARSDARIRVFKLTVNRGISLNSNELAGHARGEFLAVLDHDDYLEPHAFAEVTAVAHSGKFDLIYSDEDIVSSRLKIPSPPNIKPDWAPDSFRSCNYICHLCCFRRTLFEEVGGFRPEYDGSQDYDLFLRLTERTDRIAHIPKVLYHWRRHWLSTASGNDADAKPLAWEASRLALESHLRRSKDEEAHAEMGSTFGTLRVRYVRRSDPSVEIIIPSINHENTLVRCLDSIEKLSRYPNYRVTIMLNGSGDFRELRKFYEGRDRIRLRHYTDPFNFSRINNVAAADSDADMLLFLNDDIEITQPDWLEGLLEHALRPGVGAVGPMLLYPDGTIQHGGISVDPVEIAVDFHRRLPQGSPGYHLRAQTVQNVSAVTGACLCTRRRLFIDVNGFDEGFPLAYNDVDFCLKLLQKGYRVIYNPFVRLIHHESLTRGLDYQGAKLERLKIEIEMMRKKWGKDGLRDRYFDPKIFRPNADLSRLAAEYLESSTERRVDLSLQTRSVN